MTLERWAALPEDETGELVDGRLEEEEVPDSIHELIVTWLTTLFRTWLAGHGFILGSGVKLAVSPQRGRKPDVVVYLPEGRIPEARGVVTVPPDIVIEIVSPSPRDERRDRVDKMDEYAAFGVPYYWIVDPALGTIEVFERSADGRYVRALAATSGSIDDVPGCAGLSLSIDALWANVARLDPSFRHDR